MRRVVILTVILLAAISLGSCMTGPFFSKKDIGGPENNALIFGSLTYQGFLGGQSLGRPKFIQLNPAFEPLIVQPFQDDTMYYLYPRPVGESWKLEQFTISEGRTITTYSMGINGKEDWDPKPLKAGLFFAGSYEYGSGNQLFKPGEGGIRPAKTPTELDLLKRLLFFYGGTAWEKVIKDRIQELSK